VWCGGGGEDLEPGVAQGLVHAVALPHLHLQQVVDQLRGCRGATSYTTVSRC